MAYVRGGQQTGRTQEGQRAAGSAGPTPVGTIGRRPPPVQDLPIEEGEFDWERVGVFGAGLALGALLGVGITFFTAPMSGPDARHAVRRRARRLAWRGTDAWEDLRDELTAATLRKKKELRRRKRRFRDAWTHGEMD